MLPATVVTEELALLLVLAVAFVAVNGTSRRCGGLSGASCLFDGDDGNGDGATRLRPPLPDWNRALNRA